MSIRLVATELWAGPEYMSASEEGVCLQELQVWIYFGPNALSGVIYIS